MSRAPSNPTREEAASFTDKAREAASTVVEKAKDVTSTVTDKIEEATSAVAQKASDVTSAVSHRTGEAIDTVVDKVQAGGTYVREGVSSMAEDVGNLIRRNPLPSLAIGFTIGFLIAQITLRRD